MALHGYGLLIGTITGYRKPRGRERHWLLIVQPGNPRHPPYRVSLNVPSAQPHDHSEIECQIVDFPANHPFVRKLVNIGTKGGAKGTSNFLLANENQGVPCLDYADGNIVDPLGFPSEADAHPKVGKAWPKQTLAKLRRGVKEAAASLEKAAESNALVAVFGTGHPMNHQTGEYPSTGFTAVDNVHMNQGAFNRTHGSLHYQENGKAQDGGLIILFESGAQGIFIKFQSQTVHTDEHGDPSITGIEKIDAVAPQICQAIMPRIPRARSQAHAIEARSVGAAAVSAMTSAAQPFGQSNAQGYVFADFDVDDATGQFIPDNDGATYKTPFVQKQSLGQTQGPVPNPRSYPVMDLTSVTGPQVPGYTQDENGQRIAFDVIGDSGAVNQTNFDRYEQKVSDLLANDAKASQPAFMFHVGDVVYYYGERAYYYGQFYDPFRAYPAPIFAIPGNHDGLIYQTSQVSLADFQSAFCATAPGRWPGAGGILRSTMTQPGVYFTLDAPLVSIIGLYSNCGESLGWLDGQQLKFLYNELIRLKQARQQSFRAIILAIHHFPRWFPGQSKKDRTSIAIDATFTKAGFWPDAVICGHAHLYQRVVRQNVGQRNRQDIPYIMTGAGGYNISPQEELAKTYMQKIGVQKGKSNRLGSVIFESGYVKATVTKPATGNPTLKFEYRSVRPQSSQPDDICTVDLLARKVIS
ncbi:DUF2278 family protein [Dyella nitratireducens]|uniref:Calcineurin-like phosphoesterase domain-containing protein n=1 Tax=Dyella nitratireducens TaxID=1849580 RepID=A0ABQ1GCI5_9GAMM|nr:DUF2278 family protein [Dyella nitratireducens]GGA41119.1 hypothetical protein GCM10010981_32900 [Dyella nitratireducens]GLQ40648.1 hypothetical protein GCM10007902_04970 [Dyella nitratireducens]